jgi:outer membrane protein assembly factor BamA
MRRVLPWALLVLFGAGTLQAQGEDDSTDDSVPWRTSYFPYLTGGSNDGPLFNFRYRYAQAAEYDDRVTANAALNAEVGFATSGSRHGYVQFRGPQVWQGWRLDARAGASREARFGYFGLGNDTEYNRDAVTDAQPYLYRTRRTRYGGTIELTRMLRPPFMVAFLGGAERDSYTSLPGPSTFATDFGEELEDTDVSGRLALIYDTRDNEFNPHKGVLLEAGTQVGSGGDGYTRLYALLRGYLTIREGTVAAGRLGASGTGGTPSLDARYRIPGWEREVTVLGGQDSHRSLDTGRLAGEHVLFGNFEVRHDVIAFGDIGAVTIIGFLDAGRVFEGESFRLTFDDLKVGGGGGIGLRILRSSIFTFNFAGGPDGYNFSFGTGWMY